MFQLYQNSLHFHFILMFKRVELRKRVKICTIKIYMYRFKKRVTGRVSGSCPEIIFREPGRNQEKEENIMRKGKYK